MFLFIILAVIAVFLLLFLVTIIGAIGAGGIVIFADVIVCVVIIALIMKWILKK